MNEIQASTEEPQPPTPVAVLPPRELRADKLEWVTYLSSFTVIAAALAYLIGFIIVNSSLFQYGMVPYDFLQPRYISAGLLYFAATTGFTGAIFLLIHLTKKKHLLGDVTNAEIRSAWIIFFIFGMSGAYLNWLLPKSNTIDGWLSALRYPSFVLALVVGAFNTTLLPLPARFGKLSLWWRIHMWETGRLSRVVLLLMLVNASARLGEAFFFFPLFLIGVWFFLSGFRPDQKVESVTSENTHGLFWGISNICLSIYAYATLTYPLISPHFGGGKPLLISIAIKPDNRKAIGRVMGREDWKCVMHNISLIHENSELLYVLPNGYLADETAIAIPKSEIITLAYQRKTKNENATCLE
ncbi:MAG: hypothetical protein Q7U76_12165 [Nitrospirota bacterium]|nr:hypothetical protein [Nitrospirota bacterium]